MITKKLLILALLMFFAGTYAGCAHIFPPPEDDLQARKLFNQLIERNAGLTEYKALADVRLESNGQVVSGRIAMAGIMPDKLRIEWLNVMGQPIASVAGDGDMITVYSHTENKVHRLHQTGTAMDPLIHVPIGVEDLQKVMTGRLPLPVDRSVQLEQSQNGAVVMVLKDRWHNIDAVLRVDRLSGRVLALKTFSGPGKLQYEIQWLQWRKEGDYVLPAKMVFESETRQRLTLTVDRFWPDVEVPESIFKLNVP